MAIGFSPSNSGLLVKGCSRAGSLKKGGGKVSSTYALSYCFYLTGNITFALQMDAFWGVVGQGLVIFFTFVGQGLVKGMKR